MVVCLPMRNWGILTLAGTQAHRHSSSIPASSSHAWYIEAHVVWMDNFKEVHDVLEKPSFCFRLGAVYKYWHSGTVLVTESLGWTNVSFSCPALQTTSTKLRFSHPGFFLLLFIDDLAKMFVKWL